MPRLVDLNVYGASYTPKRDKVCKLFVLGYDLCIIKYHVQCNGVPQTPTVAASKPRVPADAVPSQSDTTVAAARMAWVSTLT